MSKDFYYRVAVALLEEGRKSQTHSMLTLETLVIYCNRQ